MDARSRPFSLATLLLALGVVLFAVGGKLALIGCYGTDQPYADQWAAEGMYLLRGPLYYDVDLSQMISPHGEHRPALTRFWVRGLIRANGGQWDPFVELVADLLIYAAFLALVWRWLASLAGGRWLAVVAVPMAALFALPCAFENFLWGFQSCFLFMLLAGFLHVTLTMRATRSAWRWGVAQLAGLAGLFSIAAGAMSAAALVLLAMMELRRGRRDVWVWATLVANATLLALALWLLPVAVVPETTRMARLGQALVGTGYLLSWPFPSWWCCLLLQAPWLAVLAGWWRHPAGTQTAGDGVVAAVGLWVGGVAFAIAFGRVVTPHTIGVRYYDVLILGLFVNVLALARICSRETRWRRLLWSGAGLVWLMAVMVGLWRQNQPEDLGNLFNYLRSVATEQRQVVREFLVSSDPAKLQEFENTTHRFPHFSTTLDFLRDPKVPALLPPSLTPDGHAGPLSRLAVRVAAYWRLLLGVGAVFLLAGSLLCGRPRPRRADT